MAGRSDPLASLIVHSEAEQPATAVAGAAVTDRRRLGSPFDGAVSWWARGAVIDVGNPGADGPEYIKSQGHPQRDPGHPPLRPGRPRGDSRRSCWGAAGWSAVAPAMSASGVDCCGRDEWSGSTPIRTRRPVMAVGAGAVWQVR